ncbi:MAG: esterase, partial [Verrucomicrobiales bacterium VVV1]
MNRWITIFGAWSMVASPSLHAAREPKSTEVDSPEIHEDHRVTFRLVAPAASKVRLSGIQREPIEMTRSPQGLWSATVGPVSPGIYGYSFLVDGNAILDPSNPEIKPERDPNESELEIPSA